ncbi:hypothetical protein GQF01_33580 [Paenibacillus sp. 5J-6]|uniref:Uncharacterized protein n=1 Tax=Paenibacillus silvestris TaxID=2606219 RepID=A0A6L8V9V3_9BACL|nr:hypothetical protein [Paenibacillus silvestris]MZQ87055.1 hypothetical protein [Paenibacillus silvestris]
MSGLTWAAAVREGIVTMFIIVTGEESAARSALRGTQRCITSLRQPLPSKRFVQWELQAAISVKKHIFHM